MRKIGDVIASFFCIFVGIAVLVGSLKLRLGRPTEPEPGFFPFIAGVALITLSASLLLYGWFGRSTGTKPFGKLARPTILILGLFFYSLILDYAGYLLATIMLSAVVLLVMDVKKLWKIVAISLFLSIGTYLLFDRLLGVTLPLGILDAILV